MSLGGDRPRAGGLGGNKPKPGRLKRPKAPQGRASENRTQKKLSKLNARATPGSGNWAGRPGDLELAEPETFLLENKEISGRRVNAAELTKWLRKITREARTSRRQPGLTLDFVNMDGALPKQWAMIPLEMFEQLCLAAGWAALETE